VHGAKPDDIETTLGSVAKTDGVHKTLGSVPSWRRAYCAGGETLCRQYDNTSLCTFIRHTSSRRAYCARRETRWRLYDKLCTVRLGVVSNVHFAKPDGVNTIPRRSVVCTITSQKPDGAHTTLASVAKLDGVHTTHSARLYDTTSRRRA